VYNSLALQLGLDAELDVGLCGLLLGLAEDVDGPLGLVLERDVEADVIVLAELLNLLDVVLVQLDLKRLEVGRDAVGGD
jgi:hypothetical protein